MNITLPLLPELRLHKFTLLDIARYQRKYAFRTSIYWIFQAHPVIVRIRLNMRWCATLGFSFSVVVACFSDRPVRVWSVMDWTLAPYSYLIFWRWRRPRAAALDRWHSAPSLDRQCNVVNRLYYNSDHCYNEVCTRKRNIKILCIRDSAEFQQLKEKRS